MGKIELWRFFSKGERGGLLFSSILFLIVFLPLWRVASLRYEDGLIKQQRTRETILLTTRGNALTLAINKQFALLEGLHAFAEANPSDDALKKTFEIFASGLYSGSTGVRNFALAPGGIQRYVYPRRGNENVLGHDLVNDERPQVRTDVRRAVETRRMALSGPYELRQEGMGLVARKAVHVNGEFWGLATMVIDMPPIFAEAGLSPPHPDRDMALRDGAGKVIFGDAGTFEHDPVRLAIALPEGHWELGGIPRGGWRASVNGDLRIFQSIGLFVAFLITVIIHLSINRQRQLKKEVRARTAEISLSNERLSREIEEHRETEETLRESEERFRAIASNTPDHILIQDQDLRYTFVANPQLGLTDADMIGKSDYDFLAKEEADRLTEAKKEVMETGKSLHFETSLISREGSPEFFDGCYVPRYDARGQINGLIGYFRNVTHLKRTETELRRREELLSEMSRIAQIGAWEFDAATLQGTWTAETARIHDLDPADETSAKIGLGFYRGESRARIEAAVSEAIAQGKPYDLELELITPKGNRKWVRTIGQPIREGDRVVKVRGTFQDITARKQAEEEIQQLNIVLEQRVQERTTELESKIAEIERMNRLFVGRELRMAELKERIGELEEKTGSAGRH